MLLCLLFSFVTFFSLQEISDSMCMLLNVCVLHFVMFGGIWHLGFGILFQFISFRSGQICIVSAKMASEMSSRID